MTFHALAQQLGTDIKTLNEKIKGSDFLSLESAKTRTFNTYSDIYRKPFNSDITALFLRNGANGEGSLYIRSEVPGLDVYHIPLYQKYQYVSFPDETVNNFKLFIPDNTLEPKYFPFDLRSLYIAKEKFNSLVETQKTEIKAKHTEFLTYLFQLASFEGMDIRLPKGSIWYLNKAIFIDINIKDVDGNGSTVYFSTGEETSGFITANENTPISSGKIGGGFKFHGFKVEPLSETDLGVRGFYGRNTSHVEVFDNEFTTLRDEPVLFLIQPQYCQDYKDQGKLYLDSLGNNKVYNNKITFKRQLNGAHSNGIFFNVDMRTLTGLNTNGSVKGMDDWYVEDLSRLNSIPTTEFMHENAVVFGNDVTGSRYGVAFFYTKNGLIKNNVTRNNIRGLVLQNGCQNIIMDSNQVYDNESSGILLNYYSQDNIVSNNKVISSLARGQGMIHSSVGGSRNVFENNTLIYTGNPSSAAEYPMWGFYLGVDCSDVIVRNNTVSVKCKKAAFAIETDWILADSATESYGSTMANTGAYPASWTNVGMGNISITGNTIIQDSSAHTAVYIRSNASAALSNVTFTNNTVRAKDGMRIRILKDTNGSVTGLITGNNTYDSIHDGRYTIGQQAWYTAINKDITRPVTAWESTLYGGGSSGNGITSVWATIDSNSAITAPTANGALVNMATNASGSTILNRINGGSPGQTMMMRYTNGMTIQNSSSTRLIGGQASSIALDSNKISGFLCLATNVWLETSRNF